MDGPNISTRPRVSDEATFQQLTDLLAAARPLAVALTPPVFQSEGSPTRASSHLSYPRQFDRRLDLPRTAAAAAEIDPVLAAVHDIAVSAFQQWIDRLSGKACPTLEENSRLAEMVVDRVNRFGLGLYIDYHGEVMRVRLLGTPHMSAKNPDSPARKAGVFGLVGCDDTTPHTYKHGTRITATAMFPPLVVARSIDEARQKLAERASAAAD